MKCRPGYAACNNRNSTIIRGHDCFHPEKHRCDGILHCPSGEDELNCGKLDIAIRKPFSSIYHCRSKLSRSVNV